MRVLSPRHTGFCPGIKAAEGRIFEVKEHIAEPIYVYGHLIHNNAYIEHLAAQSIKTLRSIESAPLGSSVAIRTHGVSKELERELRRRFRVTDLTCAKVKRLQLLIEEHAGAGGFTVITGNKSHPEVEGLRSYAEDHVVIETEDDLQRCDPHLWRCRNEEILVVSQTTGGRRLFEATVKALNARAAGFHVECCDSICPITERREKESLEIQRRVDVTLVVGDTISSNAKKLYAALKSHSPETYFVRDLDEVKCLELSPRRYRSAQVVLSSSTPSFIETEIVSYLATL